MGDLTVLYCNIDDFWKRFKSEWEKHLIDIGKNKRGPEAELSISEMMVIIIVFHQSNYRTFKHFYGHISLHFKSYFPKLISYDRFVYVMKNLFIPLFAYLLQNAGAITGIAFIDYTSIKVCYNKRIRINKVFKSLAKRGKTLRVGSMALSSN